MEGVKLEMTGGNVVENAIAEFGESESDVESNRQSRSSSGGRRETGNRGKGKNRRGRGQRGNDHDNGYPEPLSESPTSFGVGGEDEMTQTTAATTPSTDSEVVENPGKVLQDLGGIGSNTPAPENNGENRADSQPDVHPCPLCGYPRNLKGRTKEPHEVCRSCRQRYEAYCDAKDPVVLAQALFTGESFEKKMSLVEWVLSEIDLGFFESEAKEAEKAHASVVKSVDRIVDRKGDEVDALLKAAEKSYGSTLASNVKAEILLLSVQKVFGITIDENTVDQNNPNRKMGQVRRRARASVERSCGLGKMDLMKDRLEAARSTKPKLEAQLAEKASDESSSDADAEADEGAEATSSSSSTPEVSPETKEPVDYDGMNLTKLKLLAQRPARTDGSPGLSRLTSKML